MSVLSGTITADMEDIMFRMCIAMAALLMLAACQSAEMKRCKAFGIQSPDQLAICENTLKTKHVP